MRAVVAVLSFVAGAAVAASAFWVGRESGGGETLPLAPSGRNAVADLVPRIEDLEARIETLSRSLSATVVRSEDKAPVAAGAASPQTNAAGPGVPGAPTGAAGGPGADRFGGFDEIRKLREAPDDETRLKLAREILKSDNPMLAMTALRTLADLAPKEALATIDGWVASGANGQQPGWQVERALATLLESKGAALLATDLDAKMREWYQRGDDDLKRTTARSLENRGDAAPMQQLVASYRGDLGNSDIGKRTRAVESLGRTRSKEAVPSLLPLLSDTSDEVRLGALDALRRTGNEAVIEKVRPLLDDPIAAVRDRATRTIESLRRGEQNQDWGGFRGGDFRGGDPRGGGFPFDGGRRGSN